MNEGSGDVVRDHSKYRNDGKINGATWVEDKDGWCLEFDGEDDLMNISVDGLLDTSEHVTFDFEIYTPTSLAKMNNYFLTLNRASNDRFIFIGAQNGLSIGLQDDIDDTSENFYAIQTTLNAWYRITIIFTSSWFFVFLDGQLKHIYENALGKTFADMDIDYVTFGRSFYNSASIGGSRFKNVRLFGAARWDVAHGYDNTPSAVFAWDDNSKNPDKYVPDDSDCVLKLDFNEGSGTVVHDASGKGHNSIGGTFPAWFLTSARGEMGTSLDFELSSSHYLNFGDHNDFSFGNGTSDVPVSMEAWFKLESLGATRTIIAKYPASSGNDEWHWAVDATGKMYLALFDTAGGTNFLIIRSASNVITVGKWYYVAWTYNGSGEGGVTLYLNGVEDPQTETLYGTYNAMGNKTSVMQVGRYAATGYWDGIIDRIRIHRRELSAGEIAARYRSSNHIDLYQSTRVFNASWPFKGYPIVENGLVRLSFPTYQQASKIGDTEDYSGGNNTWSAMNYPHPVIEFWYENSWHRVYDVEFFSLKDGRANVWEVLDSSRHSATEVELIELTPFHAMIRFSWYGKDSLRVAEPHVKYSVLLTIRGGSPVVYWRFETEHGYKYGAQMINVKNYGSALPMEYFFTPHLRKEIFHW